MNILRRVILPIGFLAVLALIAVSLAWIAFKPAPSAGEDDLIPTGMMGEEEVMVERMDLANTLVLKGTIRADAPVDAKASHTGTVNHFFVSAGQEVASGAELYQIRVPESSDGDADAGGEGDSDAPASRSETYRYYSVRAPESGTVRSFTAERGDEVSKGDAVMQISSGSFRAVGDIEPADLYRLTDRPDEATITIVRGPEPFTCTGLRVDDDAAPKAASGGDGSEDGDGSELDDGSDGSGAGEGGSTVSCAVPDAVTAFNDLPMSMEIVAGSAEGVLAVPVTSVRGTTEKGTVWVLDDTGETEEREITLGVNDGSMIEVAEGLEEGEMVLLFVPGTGPGSSDEDEEFGDEEMSMGQGRVLTGEAA